MDLGWYVVLVYFVSLILGLLWFVTNEHLKGHVVPARFDPRHEIGLQPIFHEPTQA